MVAARMQTRDRILIAFAELLNDRLYSETNPTDIIKQSGVARSTFYRNYASVYDVLLDYFNDLYDKFEVAAPPVNFENVEYLTYVFRFYGDRSAMFRNILLAGLSEIWLDTIIQYHLNKRGDMPTGSLEKYWLYYYAGAVYCSVRQWLLDGKPGTPEAIAIVLASRSFV